MYTFLTSRFNIGIVTWWMHFLSHPIQFSRQSHLHFYPHGLMYSTAESMFKVLPEILLQAISTHLHQTVPLHKDSFLFSVPYVREVHNITTYRVADKIVFADLVYNDIQHSRLWCHTDRANHDFCYIFSHYLPLSSDFYRQPKSATIEMKLVRLSQIVVCFSEQNKTRIL